MRKEERSELNKLSSGKAVSDAIKQNTSKYHSTRNK